MRWEDLFDDLEAQYDAARDAEMAAEVSDRTRRELALVRLTDRLRPALGQLLTVRIGGVGTLRARLIRVGPDWFLLAEPAGREALVSARAVVSIGGLAAQSAGGHSAGGHSAGGHSAGGHSAGGRAASRVEARLTLAFALRGIVRDRSPVILYYIDGSTTAGTLDRVGADFVEIAEHPSGEVRRRDAVRVVRTVPFRGLAVVRRTGSG